MAYLSFAALCCATLTAILGRRSQAIAFVSVMIAGGCLRNVSPAEVSPALTVAAYVMFGVCLVAALSGLSKKTERADRRVILSALGYLSSLGLVALAMWLDQRVLVIIAMTLAVIAFVVMATLMVRWSNGLRTTLGVVLMVGAVMTAATAAQQTPQVLIPAPAPAPLEPEDARFLQQAARDSMAEVELAELARWKSANFDLRGLAASIENDHTNAHEQLKTLASKKDVLLPTGPDQLQSTTTGRFSKMVGESFDRNYVNEMVTDHLRAVARVSAGTNSADPDVRAIAETMLRSVREHLRRAQALQKTLK